MKAKKLDYKKPRLRPLNSEKICSCVDGSSAAADLSCTIGGNPFSSCSDGSSAVISKGFSACNDGTNAVNLGGFGCQNGNVAGGTGGVGCNAGITPTSTSCASGTGPTAI